MGAKLWWNDRVLSPDFRGADGFSSLVRAEPVEEGVTTPAVRRLLEAVDDDDNFGVFERLDGRGASGRWNFSSASSSSNSFKASSSCSSRCRDALVPFLGGGVGASASISSSASCSSTVFRGMLRSTVHVFSSVTIAKVQLKLDVKGRYCATRLQ